MSSSSGPAPIGEGMAAVRALVDAARGYGSGKGTLEEETRRYHALLSFIHGLEDRLAAVEASYAAVEASYAAVEASYAAAETSRAALEAP